MAGETAQYLANILLVGASRGDALSAAQEALFENICRERRADPAEIAQARRALREAEARPVPVGRYSERLRNLEDMLFLAMAEGALDEAGKSRILDFARDIGVSQGQMRLLAEETRGRFFQERPQVRCPGCGIFVPATNRFCAECGSKLHSLKLSGSAAPPRPPAGGVCVDVAGLPAEALAGLSGKTVQRQEWVEDGQPCQRFTWPLRKMLEAVPLLERLNEVPARQAYLDGQALDWSMLFGFLPCLAERRQAYRPEAHCFGLTRDTLNIWGCARAGLDWTADAAWFGYGHFESAQVFALDKQEIRHALEHALRPYRYCPFLDWAKLEQSLQHLPSRVALNGQDAWSARESPRETPRALKLDDGRAPGQGKTRYLTGIAPRNYDLAKKIIAGVFPESRVRQLLQGGKA